MVATVVTHTCGGGSAGSALFASSVATHRALSANAATSVAYSRCRLHENVPTRPRAASANEASFFGDAERLVTTDTVWPALAMPATISSSVGCTNGSPPEILTSHAPRSRANASRKRGVSRDHRPRSSLKRCVQ